MSTEHWRRKLKQTHIKEDIHDQRSAQSISVNGYPTKVIYIQCNIHQNSNDIIPQVKKISLKHHLEAEKTQTAKEILSKYSNTGGSTSQYLPSRYARDQQQ
jgi:hypothetical protein